MKTISFVAIGQPSEKEVDLFLRDLQSFFQMTNDYSVHLPKHWRYNAKQNQSLDIFTYDSLSLISFFEPRHSQGSTPKMAKPQPTSQSSATLDQKSGTSQREYAALQSLDSRWTFFIDAAMSTPFVEVLKHLSLHRESIDFIVADLKHTQSKIFGLTEQERTLFDFDTQLPLVSLSTEALFQLLKEIREEFSKAHEPMEGDNQFASTKPPAEHESFAGMQGHQQITRYPESWGAALLDRLFKDLFQRLFKNRTKLELMPLNTQYLIFLSSLAKKAQSKNLILARPQTTWIYRGGLTEP
ncbi:MAG: hypothetical protein COT74_00920 [Bdellovibrionales bacterium CG10_big_fil_rev_8_21_14_0_10_45_34]|nr:MAG: hypothetical protein COT74_00920 [Bdellovibrionales bacterium CG10_big_fil_rev_8_21_14_0_10_45_34]